MRQLKSEYPFPYIHSTLSEKYTKKIRTAKPAFGFLESPLFPGAPIYKTLCFFCWLGLFALPNLRLLRFVLSYFPALR